MLTNITHLSQLVSKRNVEWSFADMKTKSTYDSHSEDQISMIRKQ